MNLQNLNIGDKVQYGNRTLEVVDFQCYKTPMFTEAYGDIYATPLFKDESGNKQVIHERFWELVS